MPLTNAERQMRARARNKEVRDLKRLSQWVSCKAHDALGRIAGFEGVTRSKALENLLLKEYEKYPKG